jgi:hypothetical protein
MSFYDVLLIEILAHRVQSYLNQAGQNLGHALLSNRRIQLLSLGSLHAL